MGFDEFAVRSRLSECYIVGVFVGLAYMHVTHFLAMTVPAEVGNANWVVFADFLPQLHHAVHPLSLGRTLLIGP